MIDFVTGRLVRRTADRAVVQTGGVGLVLRCPPSTLHGLVEGETVSLAASLVVREDSFTLYGFAADDERDVFDQVQTVSGIGPRIALALLSVLNPDELRAAVAMQDIDVLTRVPGIGKKGAQRLVLELKDKLAAPVAAVVSKGSGPAAVTATWEVQLHAAIVGLGWGPRDAEEAVAAVTPMAEEGSPVPELLRAALRRLDRAS